MGTCPVIVAWAANRRLPVTKFSTKPPQKILNSTRSEDTGNGRPTPSNRSPMMNAVPADSPMPTLWRKRTVGKPQIESDSEIQVGTDWLCNHSKNDSMHGPAEEAPQTTRPHEYQTNSKGVPL